jgi:small subunit ribosomal protein S5
MWKTSHCSIYLIGKSGSVKITLKPAPRGIGLATANVAKKILTLAGVKDCWAFASGKTKTTVNFAKAVFNALEDDAEMRVMPSQIKKLGIVTGSIGIVQQEEQKNIAINNIDKPELKEAK